MRRLNRIEAKPPADWGAKVAKALPNCTTYDREAKRFEKLGINNAKRREGFKAFAPQVLSKVKGKPAFPPVWGEAKPALAGMSHDKCAYCEGDINAARCQQVEHFKPKSLFPSLAYDWDNYFLACGGCNGAKGDKWPQSGGYLRPDQGDPASELEFQADGTVGPVRAGGDAGQTIRDFDLNRRPLVRRRKKHVELALGWLEVAAETHQADPAKLLPLAQWQWKRLGDPENAYSVALSQCFSCEWARLCPGVPL